MNDQREEVNKQKLLDKKSKRQPKKNKKIAEEGDWKQERRFANMKQNQPESEKFVEDF